jgi:hypothetical protein
MERAARSTRLYPSDTDGLVVSMRLFRRHRVSQAERERRLEQMVNIHALNLAIRWTDDPEQRAALTEKLIAVAGPSADPGWADRIRFYANYPRPES